MEPEGGTLKPGRGSNTSFCVSPHTQSSFSTVTISVPSVSFKVGLMDPQPQPSSHRCPRPKPGSILGAILSSSNAAPFWGLLKALLNFCESSVLYP